MAEPTVDALSQLRDLTRRTKTLHDLQTYHLNMWLLGYATHLGPGDLAILVDFETHTLDYAMKKKPWYKIKPAKFAEKLTSVATWVQFLLGEEWKVRFLIGNKVVHEVAARGPPPKSIAENIRTLSTMMPGTPQVTEEDDYGTH